MLNKFLEFFDLSKLRCIGYAAFIGMVMGILTAVMIKGLFFIIGLQKLLPFESFYLAPLILPVVWYINSLISGKNVVFQEDETEPEGAENDYSSPFYILQENRFLFTSCALSKNIVFLFPVNNYLFAIQLFIKNKQGAYYA